MADGMAAWRSTAAADYVAVVGILGLFLLPGGRPRRFVAIVESQAGGRPRRRPWLWARRSMVKIACSSCSRSCRNSARILVRSISFLHDVAAGAYRFEYM